MDALVPRYTREESENWLKQQAAYREAGTAYDFAITDSTGRYLGGCGINHISAHYGMGNLGYWVRTSAMGRGVAPAAVRVLADWAFCETALNRLEIVTAVGNERSARVAIKAGAVREGVLRARILLADGPCDAVMHSLVRSDWPPKNV